MEPTPATTKGRSNKQTAKATAAAANGKASFSSEKQQASDETVTLTANGVSAADGERNYWLLKAEPETRLENGVDVRFSIDDLAAKTEPEPWDGKSIRIGA